MSKFLETLAGKLADRWLTLLVLPGALYLVTAIAAASLGHDGWYRVDVLYRDLTKIAAEPATRNPGTIALALAGVLATAAALGILDQALGSMFHAIWFGSSRGPLTRALTRRRVRRWDAANERVREASVAAARAQVADEPDAAALLRTAEELSAARNAISLVRPARPFTAGDRLAAADQRVLKHYGLDLVSAWPRLWLVLPDASRAALQEANAAVTAAERLAGWAVAYLALTTLWWPAALIGVVCLTVAWRRATSAAAVLADLAEAVIDIHGRALAESLGISSEGPFGKETGAAITAVLRKGI
ncbi:hypothetical protein [Kutzneria sp. NPDC051319]|uniref:hypothetical protein n=1 Tax=Kutzneria sp. NPDC051319 TaxID=3155047 RepID=UPI0034184282